MGKGEYAGKQGPSSHIAGSFGLYQEENATDRSDWNRKTIERISGIGTMQNGGGGIN